MSPAEQAADMLAGYAFAITFRRRVLELRAEYGLLPSEAARLVMREWGGR